MDDVDRVELGTALRDGTLRLAAVQEAAVRNVAERVDVAVSLVVVVEPDVVLGEALCPRSGVRVRQHRHVVIGRVRIVDAPPSGQRSAERDRDPARDELRGVCDPIGGQIVKSATLASTGPAPPGADLLEERAKLAGGDLDAISAGRHFRLAEWMPSCISCPPRTEPSGVAHRWFDVPRARRRCRAQPTAVAGVWVDDRVLQE